MKPPLSRYVEVDTSPERISKIWGRISTELRASGVQTDAAESDSAPLGSKTRLRVTPKFWTVLAQPNFAWAGGALLAAVVAVAVVHPWRSGEWGFGASAWFGADSAQRLRVGQGATLETNTEALAVSMDDGSGLALSPNTKIEIAQGKADEALDPAQIDPTQIEGRSRVAVHLTKGKVQCDVTPNPKRRFVVLANGVEVRVTGTSFSVELSPNLDEVRVQVKAGTVEVAPPGSAGHERRLSAGEVWAIDLNAASATASADGAPSLGPQAGEPTTPNDRMQGEPLQGDSALQGEGSTALPERLRKAGPAAPVPPALDSSPNAGEPGAHALSAAELFDRANAARRGGNVAEAVRGYETLLASFPSDGRAGLAAFELGRLRMDRLGDYASAVSALKRAVSLAPGSGFREDAMARLVQAYAALGSKSACQSARDAYLKAYPKGVHLGTVSRKCD